MSVCPCCRRTVESYRVLVSLDWNVLIWRDHVVEVPGKLAELAHILAEHMPSPVSADHLMLRLYGLHPPRSDVKALHNHIRRLRSVLPEGIELVTLPSAYAFRRN